jgi:hypothetical protein
MLMEQILALAHCTVIADVRTLKDLGEWSAKHVN